MSPGEAESKDDDDDDDDDDSDKTGVYILIVFGVICFVLGTVVCVYGIVKSRQRSTIDQPAPGSSPPSRTANLRAESTPIPMEEVPVPRGNTGSNSMPNAFPGMDSKPIGVPIAQGEKPTQHMNTVFGAPGARQDAIPVVFDQETALLGNAQPKKFQIGTSILDSRRSIVAANQTPVEREPVAGPGRSMDTEGFEDDSLQPHQRVDAQKRAPPDKPNYPSPNAGEDEL